MNLVIDASCIVYLLSIVTIDARMGPHIVTGTIFRPKDGLKIPFKAWYDPKHFRSRIDYFNGEIKTYQFPHGKKHTSLYRINPASDTLKKWTTCYRFQQDGIFSQPAIPISMNQLNPKRVTLNGVSCTKFSTNSNSGHITIIEHYYVRYENSIEIPLRYEQSIKYLSYTKYHYLVYSHYTPANSISNKVFNVDPNIVSKCYTVKKHKYQNPMEDFVIPIKISVFQNSNPHSNLGNKNEKKYISTQNEVNHREKILSRNLKLIEAINFNRHRSYKLGVNQFTDRTDEEFSTLLGTRISSTSKFNDYFNLNISPIANCLALPKQFDWRKKDCVTPVKNQHSCGSSYIFALVGALECIYSKKFRKSVRMSEQSLLECASWTRDMPGGGCFGGSPQLIIRQLQKLGGIPAERDYYRQYSAMETTCHWKNSSLVARIQKIGSVPKYNISELKQALYQYGPIVVYVHVSREFRFYASGVFDDPRCTNMTLNHAMLLVGYGHQDGKRFWSLKNSWGPDWGDNGYIKISQENNRCGILNYPVFVVL